MLIAVVSDTHLSELAPWFVAVCERYLFSADHVLHCGDIVAPEVLRYLSGHPNFHAVRGNCDWRLDGLDPVLRLEVSGLRIGLTHGWGERAGVAGRVAEALAPDCDLVCYGHTHARDWSERRGARLLNPGSLDRAQGSLALVRIGPDREMSCEFVVPGP
ncbi:MAG: YfcE family phosphodiesterase [Desulfovibrionaceae bacterium]|nr:YfcE family phosphodiesterase [Desulfovibrionaceae bacterium]